MWKEVVVDYVVILSRHSSGGTGNPGEASVRTERGEPLGRDSNPGSPEYGATQSYRISRRNQETGYGAITGGR
jgi:hypothetical protein